MHIWRFSWIVLNVYWAHWFVIFALIIEFSLSMGVHLQIFFKLIVNTNLLVINSIVIQLHINYQVAIKYILQIDIPNMKWNRIGKKLLLQKKNQSTNNYTLIQYKYV